MEKALVVLGSLLGAAVLVVLGLLFLASRAKPLPGIRETLESLPGPERGALEAACRLGGVELVSLRPIGASSAYLFRDDRNRASVFVRDGHVRALCLARTTFTAVPDFRGLSHLEALWLPDGRLPGWPDLSPLTALVELHLEGQPLGTPPSERLPPNVQTLGLDRTKVDDASPLARLSSLRTLGLAGTAIQDFAPLLPLRLEALDLSGTPVASVPTEPPPAAGAWKVDLTGAPAVTPPGFSWEGPGSFSFTGTALGNETRSGGLVGSRPFDITVTGSELSGLRPVHLPSSREAGLTIPPVLLEARVETGRARVWLGEPPGVFSSPWFTRGHVKGFGLVRRFGHVFADVEAGKPASLRGTLLLVGPVEHHDRHFMVQPLEGPAVTGLRFRVRSE